MNLYFLQLTIIVYIIIQRMSKRGKSSRKRNPALSILTAEGSPNEQSPNILKTPHIRIMEARKILNGSHNPDKFKFRQKQIANIESTIKKLLSKDKPKKSRILMLTGSPGTGKTLSANFVLRNSPYRAIYMNANSIKNKSDVQQILARELLDPEMIPETLTTFKMINLLENQDIPPTILYIEEIELFFKSSTQVLSEDFFDIFNHKNIRIMLLGISNTIDAVQKYGEKMGVRVEDIINIVFNPYSQQEMISIIEEKLGETEKKTGIRMQFTGNLLKYSVNKLCQTKQSDMRYVFEFLKSLGKNVLIESQTEIDNIPITITQINKSLRQLKINKVSLFESIPVSQQIVLIAIYNHLKKYDEIFLNEQSLKKALKEVYEELSLRSGYDRQLRQQLSELEDNGFIQMKGKKNSNLKDRIFLKVSLEDIKFTYEDDPKLGKLILY